MIVVFLIHTIHAILGPTFRGKRMTSTQRQLAIALLVFLGFITLMIILSHLGRNGYDGDYISDPMLDPMNNPNIHVKEAWYVLYIQSKIIVTSYPIPSKESFVGSQQIAFWI